MKKTEMLKKNYEFRKVLSKGKYYSGKYIEAFIMKNKSEKILLGIAINTKIGKAVKRNLIKRLIRENYTKNEDNLKEGYSIVFLWKKNSDISNAKFKNVQTDMINILNKAEILKEIEEGL